MKIAKPHLFIEWMENGERVKLGPYYNARPDGLDIISYKWRCYEVQDENFQFRRITAPWTHTFSP